jgi:hypothetical protein
MPDNVLKVGPEIVSVVLWTVVLFAAALALAVRHRARVASGSQGNRPADQEGESETIGPDGYIDSFANTIEEAGGSLPRIAGVIMIALIVAYFAYLIMYWQPN